MRVFLRGIIQILLTVISFPIIVLLAIIDMVMLIGSNFDCDYEMLFHQYMTKIREL